MTDGLPLFQYDDLSLSVRSPDEWVVETIDVAGDRVLVVDDFLLEPERARSVALASRWASATAGYPGKRTEIGLPLDSLRSALTRLEIDHTAVTSARAFFSMVDRRLSDLAPNQSIPHVDPEALAGVVYLNPPEQCRGGTGFYRHRPTGMHRVADKRVLSDPWLIAETYGLPDLDAVKRFLGIGASAAQSHVMDSDDTWELVALVPMRANRFVIYDGSLLHSPYVKTDDFGTAPDERRLTLNIFADTSGV